MGTIFQHPVNHLSTTLAAQHANGSGQLVLQAGDGAALGALLSYEVYRVTALTNPGLSEAIVAIFEATGLSGDTLTGATAVEGTSDQVINAGVVVQVRPTAKTFSAIHAAVHKQESPPLTAVAAGLTLTSADAGKRLACADAGSPADYTIALPDPSTMLGECVHLVVDDAMTKLVTLDAGSGKTIHGQRTRVLCAGEAGTFVAMSASKWARVAGKFVAMAAELALEAGSQPAQIVPDATQAIVNLNTARKDPFGLCNGGTHKIGVRRAGRYAWGITGAINNAAAPGRGIFFPVKNLVVATTAGFDQLEFWAGAIGAYPCASLGGEVDLAAGDTLSMTVINVTGGNLGLLGQVGNAACRLQVRELDPWL